MAAAAVLTGARSIAVAVDGKSLRGGRRLGHGQLVGLT
jgi:hypothetical protein